MIKIIIAGSRDFNDYNLLVKRCHQIFRKLSSKGYLTGSIPTDTNNMEIISGTARGADSLGERFAKEYKIPLKRFPAKWDLFGKRAGYIRNLDMAEYASKDCKLGILISFWDGESKGTENMINIAKLYKLKTFTIKYKGIE